MSDVIQFPSESRQDAVPPQEGLSDDDIQRLVAECARISGELFELTPVVGTLENGARYVEIHYNGGRLMWTVCRERGELAVYDADSWGDNYGEDVPRGIKVVERLREALTPDD